MTSDPYWLFALVSDITMQGGIYLQGQDSLPCLICERYNFVNIWGLPSWCEYEILERY
jgi:hypothetical protein